MNCMSLNLPFDIDERVRSRILCFLLFVVTFFTSLSSAAALLITPSRVVFEDRTRSEQVTLTNKGNETTTYRISFVRKKMTEHGQFVMVDEGEEGMYSDEMVRYSPRQIVLAPGQSQVVRLLLRKPRGLADGEYRSHMLMQALPKVTQTDISKAVDEGGEGISIEITTVLGISIPVIVRNGSLDASMTFSNVRYVKSDDAENKSYISLDMNRTGSQSTYGDFRVTHIDEAGNKVVVAIIKGVAVYTPNTLRKYQIPLGAPDGKAFDNGRFHITYTESGKDESTGLIASADLEL